MLKYMLAGALALAATAAHAAVVTPTDLQGWTAVNVLGAGTVAITDTYKPAGHTGSLEFSTGGGSSKADFRHAVNGTLGDLLTGSLSFDYLVDSDSTVAKHLAPAFRLAYTDDATGKSGYLIWEDVYNGGASGVPVDYDTWVSNNILGGNFWMRAFGSPSVTIEKYSVTLADWANGTSFSNPNSHVLSANTRITAVEVGVGSGWSGSFKGAVDNVNVSFGRSGTGVSANFEVGVVPEPATWGLMIVGFGAAGAVLRRRRETIAA
ncbi:MAG: PEPxxWA-CTERM sorting domain-containing protein [Pseudomonadota bacterium]